MSDISITLLPEEPVIKDTFKDYLIGKEVQIFDYKLADFDPNSGSTPTSLGSITISAADFPANPDDVYLPLAFPITTGQTSADLLVKLIDPAFPNEPLLEETLNYQFIIETNNFSANKEPSKYTNGYILVPVGAGGYASLFKKDGTPPPYEDLETALDTVMAEAGNNTTSVKDLNYLQCLHLAREIVWRYLPVAVTRPEGKIKKLYDFEEDATTGEIIEKPDRNEKRVRFESELKKHYNDGEKEAQKLATFVFAFSCAQWIEDFSSGVEDILFRFPVKLPNSGSEEINISGLSSGLVTIPAQYAYAHGIKVPVDVDRENRFKQIQTEEQDLLLKTFQSAKEQRTANLAATGKSPEQIVRLLRALDNSRPSLPTIDLAAGVYGNPNLKIEALVTSWSNHTGPDSLGFWSGSLSADDLEGHSELVMFLFSQGNVEFFNYLDGRFENIEVAGGTNSLLDISGNDEENTKDEWKQLYQDYLDDGDTVIGDAGIDFLPPGTIVERKEYFAIYACDFFGSLAEVSNEFSLEVTYHPAPIFSEAEGPIQDFVSEFITAHGSLDDLEDPDKTTPIITACFPDDACAQEWLRDKVAILFNLHQITKDITETCFTEAIRLTVWETLFALGITEKEQIQSINLTDFRACVKGTILDGPRDFTIETLDPDTQELTIEEVNCDLGALVHGNVMVTVNPPENEFIPINPGDLVNCIPPDHLAKTGRFAYLQDLLAFTIGDKTVSELLLASRDLSFDDLLVSQENAAISIPRIDVLNGLLEGMLCSQGAAAGIWDSHRFLDLLTAFKGVTIPDKEEYFLEVNDALPALSLSDLIEDFGSSTYNLSGVQGQIGGLCQTLDDALANGNFQTLDDLVSILEDQLGTNTYAPILLAFIQGMMDMDDAQFAQESAAVIAAMSPLSSNPVIDILVYLVQSAGQASPQPIAIGNFDSQAYAVFISEDKEGDRAWLQAVAQAVPPAIEVACAYEQLAVSTAVPCKLPYHQPLAISKAYLSILGTTRFELARNFSQHIHGFPYAPGEAPTDFKTHLFRYPVNQSLTLEYLDISPQEYSLFYATTPFPLGGDAVFHEQLGYASDSDLAAYANLGEFLKKNCLECCDLECWLYAGFKPLRIHDRNKNVVDLTCHDCNVFDYYIDVTDDPADPDELKHARLWHLTMLIRLARQLQKAGIQCYSCMDLVNISDKFDWISTSYEDKDGDGILELHANIDPHFLEQFVALDQLRRECGICFHVPSDNGQSVYLTDLIAGPTGPNWDVVLTHFVEGIVKKCNEGKAPEACRSPRFVKLLVEHVDLLARLAGFRSDGADSYRWHHQFTNIIRFAEVLCRICDSVFTAGQLQFIFTADAQLIGDDPYPQQTRNEAVEYPFNLPDNIGSFDLESLRQKLLDIELEQTEIDSWTWSKISAHLKSDFGFDDASFLEIGKKFFPKKLETLGYSIANIDLQFKAILAESDTAQLMWNTGQVDPFFYVSGSPGFLTCKIPLKSADVIQKMQSVRDLNPTEQEAVQNLFFAPRLALAPFATFFENFTEALSVLIETEEEESRWTYFQENFALFYKKCEVVTKHFTEHLAEELGLGDLDEKVTWKILAHLYAGDNRATEPWEDPDDLGVSPAMTFADKIQAGAFAALTKLSGTGLKGTFKDTEGEVIWREIRGGLTAYGSSENPNDQPVATVIPNLGFTPQNTPLIATVRNGIALTNGSPSEVLGGAQGYTAEYKGVLYIPESGVHTFRAGAPTEFGEIPNFDQAKHSQWQLTLQRGNKAWIVLDNDWNAPDTPGDCSIAMNLKRGAYDICFTFKQPEASLQNLEDGCPQPTGWQIKWTTPRESEWHTIPIANLYHKEPYGDLSEEVDLLYATATEFLENQYLPSIAGIRNTAIRAFAGGLLLHGSKISANPVSDTGMSELDYLLSNPSLFEGTAHYVDGGTWTTHLAGFDLNFLPVLDNYCPPDYMDERAEPTIQRVQALFQWFEQLWEISQLKKEAAAKGLDAVWLLWHEFSEDHNLPNLDGDLNRYLGVGFDQTHLVTQFHSGVNLSASDLLNEEWTIRVWEIVKRIEAWMCKFVPSSFDNAQPAKWVNVDFGSRSNESLIAFISQELAHVSTGRLEELRQASDRIRNGSRAALSGYFESLSPGASLSLNDIVLLDTSIGACDTASRLDIAIGMVQTFLNRIHLGIEYTLDVGHIVFTNKEERLWSGQYSSFKAWQTCKLRACYPENFALHDVLREDSKSPGFRFLKDNLKKDVLTMPVSGGITRLPENKAPNLSTLMPVQESVPASVSSTPRVLGRPLTSGQKHWESSAAIGRLNFWIETAEKLNIPYLRVPAASLPSAGIQYGCKDTSCCGSCEEDPFYPVTEYYFLLIESRYYEEINQTYQDWESGNNIAELLYQQDKPVSFLAWSKVENGVAGAVQWSPVGIKSEQDPIELVYNGRFQDSLWIEAKNGVTELEELSDDAGNPVSVTPGFRFDLATEEVQTLPKIGLEVPDPFNLEDDPFYFLYHDLGAPRYPKTLDGTVYLISQQLQSNCNFKGAKDWLDYVLHTLNRDNQWDNTPDTETSKRKALLLTYLENLLAWAKQLREKNTEESLNQARMVLGLAGKVMGERPKTVRLDWPEPETLSGFSPLASQLNPSLLCLYDEYLTQTEYLTYCLDLRGQSCSPVAGHPSLPGCHSPVCCDPRKDCVPESPYRFLALIGRAKEYANALSALGNSLQSAIEKGDQERLTFLREVQSNQLVHLNLEMKQNLAREAHFQVKALERTLEITQNRLVHTQNLINVGLIAQEQDYITLTQQSMVAQAASQGLNAIAQFVMLFPEIFAPVASDVGGGTKTANALQGGAAVASAIAGILQTRAQLKSNDAGNFRREQEWIHQLNDVLTVEVKQIKNQLIAAKLRLLNARKDLDNYQIQIGHSDQTLQYLRDKFTNQDLYNWQENELKKLYYQLYECALQVAYQAEKAYNIERCYAGEQFLNIPLWDNAHQGLLAGEHLTAALRNMEKKFMDTNHKRYELTKSISLYQEMPRSFLMIKYNGTSLIQVSEDLFAFDHPSHYCRVYKSISVTIPCVVGPYVNVNADMKLRSSFVRVSPKILPKECGNKETIDGYRMREDDDRFVFIPGGKDTLATSKAVQDSGYYQLSFQNEQYLTFENAGVEAEFCFTLKQSNNRFDTRTISDIILETSYMAKEGGTRYGETAAEAVKYRLPGNGELLINLPEQYPDRWYEMQSGEDNSYRLELGRADFPFLSFDADLFIKQVELFIEVAQCQECDVLQVVYQDDDCRDCDDVTINCQRSAVLGHQAFHGVLLRTFPVSDERAFLGTFCFPENMEIENVYVLITYKANPIVCHHEKQICC